MVNFSTLLINFSFSLSSLSTNPILSRNPLTSFPNQMRLSKLLNFHLSPLDCNLNLQLLLFRMLLVFLNRISERSLWTTSFLLQRTCSQTTQKSCTGTAATCSRMPWKIAQIRSKMKQRKHPSNGRCSVMRTHPSGPNGTVEEHLKAL